MLGQVKEIVRDVWVSEGYSVSSLGTDKVHPRTGHEDPERQ